MDIRKDARLTDRAAGDERETPNAVALAAGVCPRTIRRWVARYRAEGLSGPCRTAARPQPVRHYERENPGELIHIDIKKLGWIAGGQGLYR
jgi:transposase-like protein